MTERLICSLYCQPYQTEARLYIDEAHPSGKRHLVVRYDKGGYNSEPEFAAGIPDDWTEPDVMNLILWPMKNANYPAWEVPARAFGSPTLFRWWEKATQ